MKINKIYVSSFGKLKNFSIDLNGGFNEINEKNGWGKTTLATFIKSVFYGLDNGRKSLKDSDRKKYKPWNTSEKFGGYVEFSWGNNEYKIERYFGDKETDDTVKLFDLKTGRESAKTENLGKRLFSIDEEGFTSSVYFSQKDLEGDVSAGLIEKFNSSYSKENDDFYKAFDRIDKAVKEYKIRGDKGKISDLKKRIFDIEEEINVSKRAREAYKAVESEVRLLKEDCAALKNKIDVLTEKLEKTAVAETVKIKKERLFASKKRLETLSNELKNKEYLLNGRIPSDEETEKYYNCYKELVSVKEQLSGLKSALSELEKLSTDTSNKKAKITYKPIIAAASLICVLFLILGTIFVFNNIILGIIFLSVAAIGALSLFYLSLKNRKGSADKTKAIDNLIIAKKTEIGEFEKVASVYNGKLVEFFSGFNLNQSSLEEKFSALKFTVNEYNRIKSDIIAEEKNYAIYASDSDVLSPDALNNENTDDIKREILILRDNYSKKTHECAEKQSSLKNLDEKASLLSDLENVLSGTKEELEKAEEEYVILTKTKEFLSIANDNIIGKYRAPMEESFKKYLSLIDSSVNYDGIIDVDLNLTIKDGGQTHDPVFYSKGYRNLFEICKRFAFIDVLFSGEKPFIILDDPFCNLDDEKVKSGLDFLHRLSEEYQIIYFICHDSRSM